MKKIIFVLLFLISTNLYAWDKYVIEDLDGSITYLQYNPSSKDTLQDVLKDSGNQGKTYHKVSAVPDTDRKYWKWDGSQVVIDNTKKQADIDKKADDEAERQAILDKLGVTKDEWSKLNVQK